VLGFVVSFALVFQIPHGFVDRTEKGRAGLGRLASKITLPSRATVKRIAVDGDVHAASWAFTLPEAAPIGPDFVDGLARGIAEMGKRAPATELEVVHQQLLRVQDTDGGRVDVELSVDGKRQREIIYYAPLPGEVAVMVFLCPLDELPHYEPIFAAAAQGRLGPRWWQRDWPWRRVAEGAAVVTFLLALWGARAARKRLTRSEAG